MKKGVSVTSAVVMLICNVACSIVNESKPLFCQNDDDYSIEGNASWRFENNELIGSIKKGAGFVMTKDSYDDFILTLEFYPDSTINSGIFIRCKNRELSFEDCYEINIWDLHPKQENRTGAVVSRFSPLEKITTLNQWNSYRIKNEKDHLQVWLNEILLVDLHDNNLKSGPIALQAAEKGKIKFRNIRLTKLD